jgi:hypothetical protein
LVLCSKQGVSIHRAEYEDRVHNGNILIPEDWDSCSDDDDSDGSWIDVHHSSDEEEVSVDGG